MELRRLARERRDADRVLEQPACVGVVILGRRRERREVAVAEHRLDGRAQPGMRELGDEEVEEPAELVAVAAQRRRQRLRVDVRRLERANVELQPVAELLDAGEHAHRVAFREAAVEQLDVVPDARLDATGRIDELEREVRRAGLRAQLPLHADGVHGLDDPVLLELRDGHGPSLPPRPDAEARLVVAARRRRRRGSRPPPSAAMRTTPARSAAVSSPARSSTRSASSRRAASRAGSCFGTGHLRSSRSCASAPHGPSCSTRCELVSTSRWWSDAIARSTSFLSSPVASRSCGPGERAEARGSRRRPGRRRPARGSPRRASARADGATHATTRARCFPTQTRPCAGSSSFAGQRNPIGSLHETKFPSASRIDQFCSALPLTCSQSDGRTTSAFGKRSARPTLVDPRALPRRVCGSRH